MAVTDNPIWICRLCGKRVFRFNGGAVHYVYKCLSADTGWTGHIKSHYPWLERVRGKTWTFFQKYYRSEKIEDMDDLDFTH